MSKIQTENINNITPSHDLLKSLLEHYQNGRFSDAEKLSLKITKDFPYHEFAWKVLGVIFEATGRKSEAMKANQTAVTLSPQDAAAHNNLGITLKELGRLDEALASYRQAIALEPDFAEAYNNLGNTLKELGRFGEAESSYRQALELKPDFAKAHSNLGSTLKNLMRLEEAEARCSLSVRCSAIAVLLRLAGPSSIHWRLLGFGLGRMPSYWEINQRRCPHDRRPLPQGLV